MSWNLGGVERWGSYFGELVRKR